MSSCGVVILAAGGSSRLGRPKQLVEFDGVSLLRRCGLAAIESGCDPVVAVIGANSEAAAEELGGLAIQIVVNSQWQLGIGTSIRAGVTAVVATQPASEAVALVLCDQPWVDGAMIRALVKGRIESGKAICAAAYSGTLGTPAVFGAELFGELCELGDEQGGKVVIARHADEVFPVALPRAAVDVDTEDDLATLLDTPPLRRSSGQAGGAAKCWVNFGAIR